MLGRVVVENGVKKIVPLTADCGSGNPVGTVIAVYSNKVPNGYLPCNGVAFDTAQFPVLYALLQDDHTPDLRECTLKGIGESGRTVGAHVKAGGLAVGEFVDDRIQNIKVDPDSESAGICAWTDGALIPANSPFTKTTPQTQWQPSSGAMGAFQSLGFDASKNVRTGATTEVKAVGVNFCIKATSGINENQADNVLSALSPVNSVTDGDMHAVTSNAVSGAISALDVSSVGGSGKYISAISETDGKINATATDLGNMVPVNSVTSGNLHSVTSNAVNNAIAQQRFLIPLCTTFQTTKNTNFSTYHQLGGGFTDFFNNLPNISGKTKKVRLLLDAYTQSNNTITVGMRKQDAANYTILVDSRVVWGGIEVYQFSSILTAEIDPSFLSTYTLIGFKTSNSTYAVGIGYVFAEVYYE